MEEYSKRMQFSGYQERFREEVVKSALDAYDKMVDKDQQGEEPMYRTRDWKKRTSKRTSKSEEKEEE